MLAAAASIQEHVSRPVLHTERLKGLIFSCKEVNRRNSASSFFL